MKQRRRILIAVGVGILTGVLSYCLLAQRGVLASDFEYPLRAARAILAGQNPYQTITPTGPYPFESHFLYALPAALTAIPFTVFPDYLAGALFSGISSAALAYAISRVGWQYLPVFLSAPFVISLSVAQWSPLLMAASLLSSSLGWLLVCKPTMGLAGFLFNPSRRAAILGILFCAIASLVLPTWPIWFLDVSRLADSRYMAPFQTFPGILLFLAVLRWRSPQGRLLAALSVMPRHAYWYDSTLLWLVPKTFRQGLMLSILSWIAYASWLVLIPHNPEHLQHRYSWPFQIFLLYLPALVLTLSPLMIRLFRRTAVDKRRLSNLVFAAGITVSVVFVVRAIVSSPAPSSESTMLALGICALVASAVALGLEHRLHDRVTATEPTIPLQIECEVTGGDNTSAQVPPSC